VNVLFGFISSAQSFPVFMSFSRLLTAVSAAKSEAKQLLVAALRNNLK